MLSFEHSEFTRASLTLSFSLTIFLRQMFPEDSGYMSRLSAFSSGIVKSFYSSNCIAIDIDFSSRFDMTRELWVLCGGLEIQGKARSIFLQCFLGKTAGLDSRLWSLDTNAARLRLKSFLELPKQEDVFKKRSGLLSPFCRDCLLSAGLLNSRASPVLYSRDLDVFYGFGFDFSLEWHDSTGTNNLFHTFPTVPFFFPQIFSLLF